MLETIKKRVAQIASLSGTRKRTTLNRVDASFFEDVEQLAVSVLEDIAEHERQQRKEQRENEQKEQYSINTKQPVKTANTRRTEKPSSAANKRKTNTTK